MTAKKAGRLSRRITMPIRAKNGSAITMEAGASVPTARADAPMLSQKTMGSRVFERMINCASRPLPDQRRRGPHDSQDEEDAEFEKRLEQLEPEVRAHDATFRSDLVERLPAELVWRVSSVTGSAERTLQQSVAERGDDGRRGEEDGGDGGRQRQQRDERVVGVAGRAGQVLARVLVEGAFELSA